MADPQPNRRRQYIDDVKDVVDKHHSRAWEYEKQGIEFAISALRVLTYLNGGALIAIPTAAAFFSQDPKYAKWKLIAAGFAFVTGLILVAVANGGGFFTMARRAEHEMCLESESVAALKLTYFPSADDDKVREEAAEYRRSANKRTIQSNRWRFWALVCAWLSLAFFIQGCILGAYAVLT